MTTLTATIPSPLPAETAAPAASLPRYGVFGVNVTAAEPGAVVDQIIDWARAGESATVDFMPVHGLMEAARDRGHRDRMNRFDLIACDGQPVRWAVNALHDRHIRTRSYGPHVMLDVCERAAANRLPVYLYGGRPEVLAALERVLAERFPDLVIAGAESPPFRPLTEAEDAAAVDRINASGAKLVFLGLGCPRQEVYAFEHRQRIQAVQLCVGAAFDFHAGAVPMAPAWMQARGLEWLYRLTREPRRLFKRYLVTNSLFLGYFAAARLRKALGR